MIQRLRGLFISPPLPWTTASRCRRSSKTLRPALLCRRYCRRWMASLFLDKVKFAASFVADVDAEKAAFMADSQVPWGVEALSGTISKAAWRSKPSWYLVATEDRMIPPPAQHFMSKRAGSTVVEVAGSHAIYVSQPNAVAKPIETAAKGVSNKIS